MRDLRRATHRCTFVPALFMFATVFGHAATWTLVTAAPGGAGVMMQLTDGSILVESATNLQNWFKLTPDINGNYATGTWSTTAPMTSARLYFASQVLPSGKVWVLGGEYTGINANSLFQNFSNTGEIYDPVANTWTPITPYPSQTGCPALNQVTGSITSGSSVVTNVYPQTAGLLGKTVIGSGIPGGATIVNILSSTSVQLSANATATHANIFLTTNGTYTLSACFGDDPSMLLPGGTSGQILAGSIVNRNTFLYDLALDSWAATGTKVNSPEASDEEGWVKLGDGSVLTYDLFRSINATGSYAEKYSPLTGTWSSISPSDGSANGTIPQLSSSALGFELGPLLRLQDNRALVVGANQHTALYTPSTNTWAAGPDIQGSLHGNPAGFGADDAPAAILPNGHVILAADAGPSPVVSSALHTAGSLIITNITSTANFYVNWSVSGPGIPNGAVITSIDSPTQVHISQFPNGTGTTTLTFGGLFSNPTQLFDFNPTNNTISPVSPAPPDANLTSLPSFVTRMLVLPTGQLLFADSSNQLYVYTPDGSAPPASKPVINGVTYDGGGVYTLTGKQLNGQSAGAAYGDDVQSDSNYPIIRMTNASGQVFYAKTTNWSSFGVGGADGTETVSFTLNPGVTNGRYTLIVSGAGISSTPIIVNISSLP
jgi:hypothetical protein